MFISHNLYEYSKNLKSFMFRFKFGSIWELYLVTCKLISCAELIFKYIKKSGHKYKITNKYLQIISRGTI